MIRVVSVSGGKDSTATLLLAAETDWQNEVRAVFADTGNEHEITLEYIDYLESMTGYSIVRVQADFSDAMARKRDKLLAIAGGVPEEDIYGKRQFSVRWTPERAARAAELMAPTGNVFLDLCLLKGGFPSRKRQFCTQNLKGDPIDQYLAVLMATNRVESWHGVRAEESPHRRTLPDYEWGPKLSVRRPILRWGIDRVFELHRRHGVKPNPLYALGCARVGCMPCINSAKPDISNIDRRFPEHVEKVREYERLVSEGSRNPILATFFYPRTLGNERGVDAVIRWSKTTRGGRQYGLLYELEPSGCSSLYGLCE